MNNATCNVQFITGTIIGGVQFRLLVSRPVDVEEAKDVTRAIFAATVAYENEVKREQA